MSVIECATNMILPFREEYLFQHGVRVVVGWARTMFESFVPRPWSAQGEPSYFSFGSEMPSNAHITKNEPTIAMRLNLSRQ